MERIIELEIKIRTKIRLVDDERIDKKRLIYHLTFPDLYRIVEARTISEEINS